MSRLTDLLDKTQTASPGIGFAASRQLANPTIALIGRVTSTELADDPGLADSPADVLLVTMDASDAAAVERTGEAMKDRLWGARVGSISEADTCALKEAGCDFIVFDAEGTSAAVLNDDDLGSVIAVHFEDPEFDEEEAKAIRTLDIDCALLTPQDGLLPLTVKRLLAVQAMRATVRKRAILTAPADLGKAELESLRNAGIAAIAVTLADADGGIERIKDDIANLPRRRTQGGRGASSPSVGFGSSSSGDEDYEDDD